MNSFHLIFFNWGIMHYKVIHKWVSGIQYSKTSPFTSSTSFCSSLQPASGISTSFNFSFQVLWFAKLLLIRFPSYQVTTTFQQAFLLHWDHFPLSLSDYYLLCPRLPMKPFYVVIAFRHLILSFCVSLCHTQKRDHSVLVILWLPLLITVLSTTIHVTTSFLTATKYSIV